MFEQLISEIPLHVLQIAVPVTVGVFLLGLTIRFVFQYWWPAKRLQQNLRRYTADIHQLAARSPSERRTALAAVLKGTPLEPTWQEFNDTLHDQKATVDGELVTTRSRATVSSGYFFSAQKVIETPLKAEYFKHLPGILTGLGIIGTFSGLLIGLHSFDPSDPAKVQQSLQLLLSGVRDAFIASAVAIFLAILVTNSEKQHFRKCVASLEMLTDAIDRLFETGVGEEYLADLVRHTQESSVQTRLLKDSLVTDLREMLQNLVDNQVRENTKLADALSSSYKDAAHEIATQISSSIEGSFREPLDQIAKSVQTATGDQSGRVHTLMQDLLVSFMQKIESTFGGQFSGMQDMLNQSIASMQSMQGAFATLVHDMRAASESSGQAVQEQLSRTLADMQASQLQMQARTAEMVDMLQQAITSIGTQGQQTGSHMAEQLERIFAQSEARQQAMAEQMQAFVDGIRSTVGKGHEDTMQRIATSVDQLGSHLSTVLNSFEQNRASMDHAAQTAQVQQQEHLAKVLESLQQTQQTMQSMMTDALTNLQASISTIGREGESAGERIGQQLEKQFSQNEARHQQLLTQHEVQQQAAAEQMQAFIESIKTSVGKGHEETVQHIGTSVDVLTERLNGLLGTFEQRRSEMDLAAVQAQQQQQAHVSNAAVAMSDAQQHMQAAMAETLASVQASIATIGREGEHAGQLIGAQLEKQHQQHEARQQEMTRHMEALVQSVHELVAKGQQDTMLRIANTVDELTGKLTGLIASFERNRQSMDSAALAAQQQLQTGTKALLEELTGQVKALIHSVQQGHDSTRETVRLLSEQTERNLYGMQTGADKIRVAADGFTVAGQEVVRAGQAIGSLTSQLQTSATALGSTTETLGTAMKNFQTHQEGLQKSIGIVDSIVANAQAEAGMRGKVLDDLRAANDRMQALNEDAREYLQQVSGVLGNSFETFGAGVEKSLERSLATFDAELDRAVRALGGGVSELSDNLETFGDIVENSIRRHA